MTGLGPPVHHRPTPTSHWTKLANSYMTKEPIYTKAAVRTGVMPGDRHLPSHWGPTAHAPGDFGAKQMEHTVGRAPWG